jgi:hypothetical protein
MQKIDIQHPISDIYREWGLPVTLSYINPSVLRETFLYKDNTKPEKPCFHCSSCMGISKATQETDR